MIFTNISDSLSSNLGSAIELGKWSVPMPPANVDPLDYSTWFVERMNSGEGRSCTMAAMHLHESAERGFSLQRFVYRRLMIH